MCVSLCVTGVLVASPVSGRSDSTETRGTAFVVYEDIYDAKNAVDHLSGFNVGGRSVQLPVVFLVLGCSRWSSVGCLRVACGPCLAWWLLPSMSVWYLVCVVARGGKGEGGGVRIRLRTYRVHCVGVTLLLLCCVCSARGYFRYLVALYYQPNKVSKHQSMDKKREEVEALRAKFGRDEE